MSRLGVTTRLGNLALSQKHAYEQLVVETYRTSDNIT